MSSGIQSDRTHQISTYNSISRRSVGKADKHSTCEKLNQLLKISDDDTSEKTITLLNKLIEFKEARNKGLDEDKQNTILANIEDQINHIDYDKKPTLEDLMILVKNSGYFMQRDIPDTFKIFLLKLDKDVLQQVVGNHEKFLRDNGIIVDIQYIDLEKKGRLIERTTHTPLLNKYESLERRVVGKDEKQKTCDKLNNLLIGDISRGICGENFTHTKNIINLLISFKKARNDNLGKIQQENTLNEIAEELKKIQIEDEQVKPNLGDLLFLVRNSGLLKRDLPGTFKKFISNLENISVETTQAKILFPIEDFFDEDNEEFLEKNGITIEKTDRREIKNPDSIEKTKKILSWDDSDIKHWKQISTNMKEEIITIKTLKNSILEILKNKFSIPKEASIIKAKGNNNYEFKLNSNELYEKLKNNTNKKITIRMDDSGEIKTIIITGTLEDIKSLLDSSIPEESLFLQGLTGSSASK